MKKIFIITILMIWAMNGFAQQIHFDFAETIESGQTLYFLKGYYGPQDVMVTYPCFRDYYANGDHITTYYYGYEKPVGDLVIPSTITHNDTVYTVTRIDFSAFYECKDITSVVFPNTLTFIGQRSFLSCNGITGEVVIPNSVTIIGTNAFSFCHGITSVVFGHALREIRDLAFHQCYALEHISSLPDSLTKLGDDAFNRCPIRDSIIIPPGVATIGEHAFYGCRIPSVVISEGVTTIKGGAFAGCPLGALDIPSSTISISQSSFDRTRLQSITVNEGNPVYDSRDNCNALIETETNTLLFGCRNTIIPNDIAIIGYIAFFSINELNTITIPNSVERLETNAFAGCNSMTTITLPPNISYIGINALNCCGLTSIVSKSPTPPTAYNHQWEYGYDNSFMGVNRDIPIYIPVGTIDAYSNAPGWDYFNNFIETEMNLEGEWYYKILNDDGSITYQHLEYAADTTIGNERPKVIVRSNTQYDRDTIITEVTHEYVYEENGKVYWWNKDLEEFTMLYDLAAQTGDEWEIKVGYENIIMHVDTVVQYEHEGQNYRMLRVSDENDLFSGDIVCTFGHMTSFFPEKLMNRNANYTVDGLRCYWVGDELVYHEGDEDCDAIYGELHGMDEPPTENGFAVYPNPANNVLFVQTVHAPSLPAETYRITNLMGQTVLSGNITAENQQIDIANLPEGMYFITVGGQTVKFVVK